MLEFWRDGEQVCKITDAFDSRRQVPSPSNQEKVAGNILVLDHVSLEGLQRITGLTEEAILAEAEYLTKTFGVKRDGNGFSLSEDPEERLALSRFIEELMDIRFGKQGEGSDVC